MWIYSQVSGKLYRKTSVSFNLIATGYSGYDALKNDPKMQKIIGLGPIPRGDWTLGKISDVTPGGKNLPRCIPLTPSADTDTFGRNGFLIHGDSAAKPGTISEGCIIIADRSIRELMGKSGDLDLKVVEVDPVWTPH
jgi:Protein of unknown function (DUF2778)